MLNVKCRSLVHVWIADMDGSCSQPANEKLHGPGKLARLGSRRQEAVPAEQTYLFSQEESRKNKNKVKILPSK